MSTTIVDFLFDKITSFSAKMKGNSSKFSGPSYLMSNNSNSFPHQWNYVDLFNGVIRDAIIKEEFSNQIVPLKQHFGYLVNNYSFSFRNTERPFLQPLAMDIYRHSHSFHDSLFLPNDTLSQLVNSFCNQFSEMNRKQKPEVKMPKSSPLQTEMSMAVSEIHSPAKKKCELISKCTVPNTLTLNKELANRKTKEMHKRSKKRRRRQKKSRQFDNCSASISDDDDVDRCIPASVTSICVVSNDVEFGCTVALSHSLKMAPKILSSVVSVNSATDDESEWESYETEQVDSSCQKSDSSFESHLPLPESSERSQPVNCSSPKATSFLSSFIVPVEGSTDDESDWDSCDTEIFSETSEFEFTGLCVTSLCTPQTHLVDPNCSISNNTSEDDETIKLRIHLQDVNKTWNKSAEGLENKPKLPSKVSFAPDETLAEIYPIEMYERKGEWEMYATERLRFKRKIDELEKILSPCLHPDHRSKIYNKITETVL